jgi:hypothetical protein
MVEQDRGALATPRRDLIDDFVVECAVLGLGE